MSRKANLKNRFKNVCNNYIEDNTDIRTAIERVERFANKYFIFISENTEEYVAGHHDRKRLNKVLIARVALILHTLRFVIALLTKSDSVRIAMMDNTHTFAQSRMVLASGVLAAVGVLSMGLTVTYQELTNTLYTMEFVNSVKHNLLPLPLNSHHIHRICLAGNLFGKYIMLPSFYFFMASFCVSHLIYTLIFYSKLEEKLFSAIYLIIANILWTIFSIQVFCMFECGITVWFFTTSYTKYKFNEINKKILLGIKYSNLRLLMIAFREHNYIEIKVKQLNHFFRIITFLIYYIGTIVGQILLFITHHKDTTLILRLGCIIYSVALLFTLLILNLMSVSLSNSANKSYSQLFCMDYKKLKIKNRLTFRQRWKLLAFIEKLSGPTIGFYCYDLFPMNSYELYQYLYIAGCNYFLIMNFFG